MGAEEVGIRRIDVRIGAETVPVVIDEKTTAGDLKREFGLEDSENKRWVVTVNSTTLSDEERILPRLTGRNDEVIIVPVTEVGSFNFLTGEKRLRQEETLLRRIGFLPDGMGRFSGAIIARGKITRMNVYLPYTFPYSRPRITVKDKWFLGKHPCIIPHPDGAEIHFRNEQWEPWMHAVDLVVQAVSFLKSIGGDDPCRREVNIAELRRFLRELMRL